MLKFFFHRNSVVFLLFASGVCLGQPPGFGGGPSRAQVTADSFVAEMMSFDNNHDGKLARKEVTDARLIRLFDRADTNKDGVVTKEELTALYARESATFVSGPPGGPGGPGGGPGRRGPDMRSEPGEILPAFMQGMLNLTPQQKKALGELQQEVNTKLAQILTSDQKIQLKEMNKRGPGGFGPRGGGMPGPPMQPPSSH